MDKGASVPDQALAVPVEPVSRLDPTGFDPSRAFYEKRPDILWTGEIGADGEEISTSIAWDDLTEERRAEIARQAELDSKSIEQISGVISALGPLIEMYSNNVANAEERYRKEREFLADTMAEYLRLTHFVARKAAKALEDTASAIETQSAMTAGHGPKDESAVGNAETPEQRRLSPSQPSKG